MHHAYLFSGTRGVGKTTLARIFAKSLNCVTGISSIPCGDCSSCTDIDQGRMVDLLEVDAASRTKVEETRELLDNVQYVPTRSRFKIYLIDEIHMFNCLVFITIAFDREFENADNRYKPQRNSLLEVAAMR